MHSVAILGTRDKKYIKIVQVRVRFLQSQSIGLVNRGKTLLLSRSNELRLPVFQCKGYLKVLFPERSYCIPSKFHCQRCICIYLCDIYHLKCLRPSKFIVLKLLAYLYEPKNHEILNPLYGILQPIPWSIEPPTQLLL